MTNVFKSSQGRCILFTKNHLIDATLSEYLNLNDLIAQLYDLMSMIETTRMDNNEFVALKVLILLSPGIFMHKGKLEIQSLLSTLPKSAFKTCECIFLKIRAA